ncbi:MAG TPA: hypothetical protein VFJ97_07065 [Dermatophilaceae bacterium]|nr:hypothetical protein [Dermatophilaceae bacterium]
MTNAPPAEPRSRRRLDPRLPLAVLAAGLLVAVLFAVLRHGGDPAPGAEPPPGSRATAGPAPSTASPAPSPATTSAGTDGLPDLAPPDGALPAGVVRRGQPSSDRQTEPVAGAQECGPQPGVETPDRAVTWSFATSDPSRTEEARLTVTQWSRPGSGQQLGLLRRGDGGCRWLFDQTPLPWSRHDPAASWLSVGSDPRGVQVVSAVRTAGSYLVAAVGASLDRTLARDLATAIADHAVDALTTAGLVGTG